LNSSGDIAVAIASQRSRICKKNTMDLMLASKTKKIGIWKNNPTSPYCFRKPKNKHCKIDSAFMGK
jgi:hypothetical protein